MTHPEMSTRLEMRWVPVTDADGRTRMEARWLEVGQPTAAHTHSHAA